MLFKFYHADRAGLLKEETEVTLCERQLSPFGRVYWDDIVRKRSDGIQLSPNAQREFLIEEIRRTEFSYATSRLQCFFGANYLDEAVRFAKSIVPVPDKPVSIYEVYASKFVSLDMNLIDSSLSDPDFSENIRRYWRRVISNHGPLSGNRKGPNIEVLLDLPVRIGKRVVEVNVVGQST